MPVDASTFDAQRRGWSKLGALRASPIDLRRLAALHALDRAALVESARVERLLLELGLNDEGLDELPPELHRHAGGLRIWQYPTQFGRYLVQLSQLGIRSYLEIGIRHGGSFVATTEYLARFHPIDFAVGVDVIACPSMPEYRALNPKVQFWHMSSCAPEFAERLRALGTIDLVFIDSHHELEQCRRELALVAEHAHAIALHDIANIGCPDVGVLWQELARSPAYDCFEFVEQYPNLGPFQGIGLAVRKPHERAPRVQP